MRSPSQERGIQVPGNPQEEHYASAYDYRSESPHLKHRHLYEKLMARVIDAAFAAVGPGESPHILEVGAGDGAVTERLLAVGCKVTGTEMSHHSVAAMRTRFGSNNAFESLHDPEGSLDAVLGQRFDAVLFASVLHHIPDYLAAIERAVDGHLRTGGAFISIQDPLWYPRMPKTSLRLTSTCYLTWRLSRGNFVRGVKTRMRGRARGLSEEAPGYAVEYHVVRSGVGEEAIAALLQSRFESVDVLPYWSSQGTPQQWLGGRLGKTNTFAVFAASRKPQEGT